MKIYGPRHFYDSPPRIKPPPQSADDRRVERCDVPPEYILAEIDVTPIAGRAIADVALHVAAVSGMPLRAILRRGGPSEPAVLRDARRLMYWIALHAAGHSSVAVAKAVGRDHASVLHGAKTLDIVAQRASILAVIEAMTGGVDGKAVG